MGLFDFFKQNKKQNIVETKPEEKPVQKEVKVINESYIETVEDDNELLEIIKGNYGWDITKCATSKLKDQKQLLDYIKSLTKYSDKQKRGAIIAGITDQEMLGEIIRIESEYKVIQSAIKRMTDINIVKKCLIKNAYGILETDDLLKKLKDEDIIYIINNSEIAGTVERALIMVKDENLMADYTIKNNNDSLIKAITSKEALEKIAKEAEDVKIKGNALVKLGGYICVSCGKVNSPDEEVTCNCKFCGAENHNYVHVNNVQEYRDYEVGSTYDECTRCKKQINYRSINTM